MRQAAEQLGLEWQPLTLAVTFANEGDEPEVGAPIVGPSNLHGTPRFTCRLCGECNLGCNFGSKNSLDLNYLTRARQGGAEIHTLCDVREIGPREEGGYWVRYTQHQPDEAPGADRAIEADQLILAAGTLGTTELLLRNRARFPLLSSMLGQRFSSNGNLLTFVFNAREKTDGVARPRLLEPSRGPVITSAIRLPDQGDGGDGPGGYIEDAGYPLFLDWALELTRPHALGRLAAFAGRRLWTLLSGNAASNLGRELAAVIGSGTHSATSLPLAAMGRDRANGVIRLRHGRLDIDYDVDDSRETFDRLRATAAEIAQVWQGDFQPNPIKAFGRAVTVHPLGGCPMGRHRGEGVVDAYGEVFGYPGLFITDGSVLPGSVGANPALTIAALADRFADRIIDATPRTSTRTSFSLAEAQSAEVFK
jgi:cholesterol oxidase